MPIFTRGGCVYYSYLSQHTKKMSWHSAEQRAKSHERYLKNKDKINRRAMQRYIRLKKPCPECGKLIGSKSTKCSPCKLRERNPSIFIKKKGIIKNCLICNTEVYASPYNSIRRKYCSRACAAVGKPPKPKTGRYVKCDTCKKDVWIRPSNFYRKKHFCSKKCTNDFDYGGKVELICKICGKPYKTYKSHVKHRGSSFCSIVCTMKSMKTVKKTKSKDKHIYKKRLWQTFSLYIRQRDKGICISCGKEDHWRNTDAGHYIPRTAGLSLYFDEKNVHAQCTDCNRLRHGNLTQYAIALRKRYGESILEELESKRSVLRKITEQEYVDLIDLYKKKTLELNK